MIFEMKNKIKNALLNYGKEIRKERKKEPPFSKESANIFLFGVVLDQGIRWEQAWEAPKILKKRLGHLNIKKISQMKPKEMERVMFDSGTALHRYRKVARWIVDASQLLLERYQGDARNIWSDEPSAFELEHRFREFVGIAQKKGSMAVNILVRDRGIPIKGMDKIMIDISYDRHVRRVFLRTGLIESDSEEALIRAARRLNPRYPGELDGPAWRVGFTWCHPQNPDCSSCRLSSVCPKLIEKGKHIE